MSIGIIPDLGLVEVWLFQTDVISTWNGTESRMSLRPKPRVQQRGKFAALEQDERRDILALLATDLVNPNTVPLWAWSSKLTADQTAGNTAISADTTLMSLANGDYVVLVNPATRATETNTVSNVTDTGFDLDTVLTQNVTTGWFAIKAMVGLWENKRTLGWSTVTGDYEFQLDSWVDPIVQRTGTAAALNTLNSLPILERTVLAGAGEEPEFPRDVIDYGGARVIATRYSNIRRGSRAAFLVDRADSDDIDYWRLFLDTVKGNWKAFLLSTQLEDLTVSGSLTQGSSTFIVNEAPLDFATYHYIEIVYSDGTSSNHQITNIAGGTLTVSPAIPSDPKVANVDRISYLLKRRMADRCEWKHNGTKSILSFTVMTTNDG